MKTYHQSMVEKFMRLGGQDVPDSPTIPNLATRRLRASLILEEAVETIKALGFSIRAEFTNGAVEFCRAGRNDGGILLVERHEPDMIEVIDGCCDVKVVTTGTLSAFGIPDMAVQEEVDASNLAKVSAGSTKTPEGKILKPANWKRPDIAGVLSHGFGNYFSWGSSPADAGRFSVGPEVLATPEEGT